MSSVSVILRRSLRSGAIPAVCQSSSYLSTGLLDPVATSIDITELGTLRVAFDEALAILNGKQ